MQTVFDYQKKGSQPILTSYVLLSNSPRRKQLLEFLAPHIQSVEVDERVIEEHFMKEFSVDDLITLTEKPAVKFPRPSRIWN